MGLLDDHDRSVTNEARGWVVRLTSGDMTEREMRRFKKWRLDPAHERAFSGEMASWHRLGDLRDDLAPSIVLPSARQVLQRRVRRWAGQATVAMGTLGMLLLAGPELLVRVKADHVTGARVERVALPDGSTAILDAGTAITLDFKGGNRHVELVRGRAWFDVAHKPGAAFEVAAAGGVVQDIGTAFEVSRSGDEVETAVSQGRVRVFSPGTATLELTAGQRAAFRGVERLARGKDLPPQRIADWRLGNIVLEGVDVRKAIGEVARYRSGPTWILGKLDPSVPITVVLRSDRPDAALEALAAAEHLSLVRLPGGIVIVRQISAS